MVIIKIEARILETSSQVTRRRELFQLQPMGPRPMSLGPRFMQDLLRKSQNVSECDTHIYIYISIYIYIYMFFFFWIWVCFGGMFRGMFRCRFRGRFRSSGPSAKGRCGGMYQPKYRGMYRRAPFHEFLTLDLWKDPHNTLCKSSRTSVSSGMERASVPRPLHIRP